MRHQKSSNRLKQKPQHARMLKRNLITSLLLYEGVRTTKKRAQVIQPAIDRLITFAKTHEPHVAIRRLNQTVTDKNASKKVMEVYVKRFAKKNSGLTSMKLVGARVGDGAELVDLVLAEGIKENEGTTGTTEKDKSLKSQSSLKSPSSKK